MAQYDFIIEELAPDGMCPGKLARELKHALGLPKKPLLQYTGRLDGLGNYITGIVTLDGPDLSPEQLVIVDATLRATRPSLNRGEAGLDLEDLESMGGLGNGMIVYVCDLPALDLSGVAGSLAYRSPDGWRRVADDTLVVSI